MQGRLRHRLEVLVPELLDSIKIEERRVEEQ
jgi:hypothetical protein